MSDTATTPTNATFDQFGLHADILKAIAEQGYTTPTPIQAEAIPVVLSGRDKGRKGAVVEGMGLSGFGAHSNDAEYVKLDSIVPRLYLTTRMIMDLSTGKVK